MLTRQTSLCYSKEEMQAIHLKECMDALDYEIAEEIYQKNLADGVEPDWEWLKSMGFTIYTPTPGRRYGHC